MHGLPQQSVAEPVVVFAHDDDAAAHGLTDGVFDTILRKVDEAQQQRIRERPLGAGHHLHHTARVVTEAVEAGEQQVAQALRQGALGAPGDLLDEEGDALRAHLQPLQRRRGRRASRDLCDQLADRMVVESRHGHPFEQSRPRGLADEPAHRVASAHIVGAAGDEQQEAATVERAQQEGEDREGRVVGPVQVFDDDDLRRQLRGGLDEGGDRVAQAFGAGAVASGGASTSSGSSMPRASTPTPTASRTRSAPSRSTSERRMPASGPNGAREVPRSRHQPPCTSAAVAISALNSRTSRDLPIPASPSTSSAAGTPWRTPSNRRRIPASSASRPTIAAVGAGAMDPSCHCPRTSGGPGKDRTTPSVIGRRPDRTALCAEPAAPTLARVRGAAAGAADPQDAARSGPRAR